MTKQIDTVVGKATITSGLLLGRSEDPVFSAARHQYKWPVIDRELMKELNC